MRMHPIAALAPALAGVMLAVSALAQSPAAAPAATPGTPPTAPGAASVAGANPPAAGSPHNAPTPPDADPNFLLGLRRVGVMAGHAVQCAPEADRQAEIAQAMDLADEIAVHFGLRAAFNFVGALGYGSGHPFDKAGCTQAIDGWKEIQAKYLGK
jgi:hypothetical protein